MTMLLALGMGVQAASQKHRHTPQAPTELVDSANKDAVEVYSDTTGTDTAVTHTRSHKGTVTINTPWHSHTYDVDDDDIGRWLNSIDHKDIMGMFFVLCIILIIFVLAPVLIIIALFYFINKNRKQKMKLAQMAMQQGQPIPEQLLEEKPGNVDDEYQKGMRQCFVGVGLMVFLGYAAGNVGFGIGALVFCIGLGKVFASRSARKNNNRDIMRDDQI